MTAMGAKAMRNYVRTMDHTANRLVECFEEYVSYTAELLPELISTTLQTA
jgi:hypothetical protein